MSHKTKFNAKSCPAMHYPLLGLSFGLPYGIIAMSGVYDYQAMFYFLITEEH
jgi:hypothetical protein